MIKKTIYALLASVPCFIIGNETSEGIHRSNSYWYVGPDLVVGNYQLDAGAVPTLHLGVGHRTQSNHLGWDIFTGFSFPFWGAGTQVLFYPSPNTSSQMCMGLGVKGYPILWELPNAMVEPFISVGQETFSAEGQKHHFWQVSVGPKVGYFDFYEKGGYSWDVNGAAVTHLQFSYGMYF